MEKIAALEDAIEKKSLVGIYSVFYTIAHGDPNFSTHKFRDVLGYVKSKNIEGFMQEFDGEEFEPEEKWDENYWALVASSLIDNFCEERINHLEAIGRKIYPIREVAEAANRPAPAARTACNNTRLISEEEKKKLKSEHENKTRKEKGNFFTHIFDKKSSRR